MEATTQPKNRTRNQGRDRAPIYSRTASSFVHRHVLPNAFDVASPTELQTVGSPNESPFVRRVSELLPILTPEQVETLRERIDAGYYGSVEVTRVIAERLASVFGTD